MSHPARCRPHPNPPPAQPGEGVYFPSPVEDGGGLGWGQGHDANAQYLNCLHAPARSHMP